MEVCLGDFTVIPVVSVLCVHHFYDVCVSVFNCFAKYVYIHLFSMTTGKTNKTENNVGCLYSNHILAHMKCDVIPSDAWTSNVPSAFKPQTGGGH